MLHAIHPSRFVTPHPHFFPGLLVRAFSRPNLHITANKCTNKPHIAYLLRLLMDLSVTYFKYRSWDIEPTA
ncbi:hypothetical protein EYC84_004101 [Monilinia fructicola]|uniref:Uncharacterized protein n=1 Tax=Monilinia fructicola TaxID=38448 RepID=A0A5M9K202_MONFR|nr:hypothetical protein EYC84_004101 [Monilinia fructicola]